mmetsp:Transcript_25566/g.46536  ORF Transcript_25566/g.46536 Transcript_25566/m.46536 type:complete len:471 (+) Transcript_25566:39-1451(+)
MLGLLLEPAWLFVLGELLVRGDAAEQVCASSVIGRNKVEDVAEAGSALSLLQMATSARRDGLVADGQGGADLDVGRAHKQMQRSLALEEYASEQQHASSCMFPTSKSTPEDVKNFFVKFGNAGTGFDMQRENIDGDAFLSMSAGDLRRHGLSEERARTILERIETARAQEGIRQSLMREAKSNKPFDGNWTLHEIVGPDGVLMITLDRRSERFQQSAQALKRIGIRPVKVRAVDRLNASEEVLARGCPKLHDPGVEEWCRKPASRPQGRTGNGCAWPTEQAVAASHRKALEQARHGGGEWTAILEDDAVPALVEDWNRAFKELWQQLPPRVKFVRLGWCQIGSMDSPEPVIQIPYAKNDGAILVEKEGCCGTMDYEPGGCTTAYMVHKDIVEEMLNLFPCCGPVDSCYKWDFLKAKDPETAQPRGLDIMMSMDSHNRPLWDLSVEQHGVILQDRIDIESARSAGIDLPGK